MGHMQVRHVEEAGAIAAIVYDDVNEALIIMSKPRDHAETGIPAVFVAQKTGIVMRKLMTPWLTFVRITPVRSPLSCSPQPRIASGPVGSWRLLICYARKASPIWLCMVQITDAVWMSMLLSAFAGVLAVTVVVATFYFIRYCLVSLHVTLQ